MPSIAAIILAGGESRRFGRDKAEVLLRLVVEALPPRAATILVRRAGGILETPFVDRVVTDDMTLPDGPLRGIVAGLESMDQTWAWVLACDLPGVSSQLLEELPHHRCDSSLGVIPEWEGRPEPLCALYARDAARHLRNAVESGVRSVREAIEDPRFVRVPESRLREFDPDGRSFFNINTPEALHRFRSST